MKTIISVLTALMLTVGFAVAGTVETLLVAPAIFEDISVGPDGNLFLVSPPGGNVVWKVTPEGLLSTIAQNMLFPQGGAVGPDGTFYCSQWNASRVVAIDSIGTVSTVCAGISGPTGNAVSPDPRYIYTASYNWGAIYRIDTQTGTKVLLENGPEIFGPDGIAVDPQDNLYLTNFLDSRIHKRTAAGQISLLATLPGAGLGYCEYANGTLYVSGLANNVIYQVDGETGDWSVLAGTGQAGSQDGSLLDAQFDHPNGLALSPDARYLYVGESGRLRRITLGSASSVPEASSSILDLRGAAPNPFNPHTTIRFTLDQNSPVDVQVLDLRGNRVAELFSGFLPGGEHSVVWTGVDRSGRAAASGTYLVRVVAGNVTATRKMILAR